MISLYSSPSKGFCNRRFSVFPNRLHLHCKPFQSSWAEWVGPTSKEWPLGNTLHHAPLDLTHFLKGYLLFIGHHSYDFDFPEPFQWIVNLIKHQVYKIGCRYLIGDFRSGWPMQDQPKVLNFLLRLIFRNGDQYFNISTVPSPLSSAMCSLWFHQLIVAFPKARSWDLCCFHFTSLQLKASYNHMDCRRYSDVYNLRKVR